MTGRFHQLLTRGASPVPVTAAALVAVGVVGVAGLIASTPGWAAPAALVLVLPVTAAAVLGGRVPGFVTAAGAAVALSTWLSPAGSPRVALLQDVVALAVFVAVALAVSDLATRRIDAMAEVDRQRNLLLRSVSHDLRTPLATIRGVATELLDGPDHHEATRRRLLELVDVEADRLDRLVANLLALGRIESGGSAPRLTPVDLGAMVDETLRRRAMVGAGARATAGHPGARPDAGAAERVTVSAVSPGGPVELLADPAQLDVVLANLLDNAERHSPDGGRVEVSYRLGEDRYVELTVTDQGPGVSPEERELVFRPFRSGTLAGSSGVGLAVSRALVEGHAGNIRVDDAPGGGARFVVRLPVDGPPRQRGRRHP
ncbi:MAG: sensor histidine kinase [Microthrixaceae bacterium]